MYMIFSSAKFFRMPSNKPLTVEDEEQLENGGDVKDDTKRRRKKAYEDLDKYLEAKAGLSIADLIEDKNNSDAREFFSKNLGQYFWSYQVKVRIYINQNFTYFEI